jgi:hypothetical protein
MSARLQESSGSDTEKNIEDDDDITPCEDSMTVEADTISCRKSATVGQSTQLTAVVTGTALFQK